MIWPAPKKSLGQHFLRNPAICARIAGLLESHAADRIIEIGPGSGALTQELLKLPRKELLLIEKDSYWAAERARDAQTLHMDALRFDWRSLEGSWKLVGNLPYNVASPLIWDILGQCRALERAVFMTQKEVGLRICASPGSKAYGALSVWTQCHAQPRLEFFLGPGAFKPPPKVDSAVISFTPLMEAPGRPRALSSLLKIAFQQRRKQLGHVFKSLPRLLQGLADLNIDPKARAENLTCADFLALCAYLPE